MITDKIYMQDLENNIDELNKLNTTLTMELEAKEEIIKKASETIKALITPKRQDNSFHHNPMYILEMNNLLQILNEENNI